MHLAVQGWSLDALWFINIFTNEIHTAAPDSISSISLDKVFGFQY